MVTYPYAYMTYILSRLAGLVGAYRGGRPPTALTSMLYKLSVYETNISLNVGGKQT